MLKAGRTVSVCAVRLLQDDRLMLSATVTAGTLPDGEPRWAEPAVHPPEPSADAVDPSPSGPARAPAWPARASCATRRRRTRSRAARPDRPG